MKLQNENAFFNILGMLVLNGVSFFTIPIFTRMLGPEQYGITSVYKTWAEILAIIMSLQVQGSLGAAFIYFSEEKIKRYQSSVLLLGLFFSSLCFITGIVFSNLISRWLLFSKETLSILGLYSMGLFVINFAITAFIYLKKSKYNFYVNTVIVLIDTLLSVYLIMYVFPSEKLYMGRIYGSSIPVVLFAIFLAFYFLIKGTFSFDFECIKFCIPICLPLVFHGLSHIVLGQSDRIMLQHMMGNAEAGVYSFMVFFTSVLLVIWNALNNTWIPFYFEDLKGNQLELIEKKTKNYICIFSIIAIVFSCWAVEVIKIFSPPSFWYSTRLLPFFVLSNYFIFLYSFPVNFQFFHRMTYSIAAGTLLAALSNILLNILMIPKWGVTGAAIATLLAHILLFVFHEIIADKVVKSDYHYSFQIFVPGLLFTTFFICLSYFLEDYMMIRWIVGILFSVYFVLDIYKRKSLF